MSTNGSKKVHGRGGREARPSARRPERRRRSWLAVAAGVIALALSAGGYALIAPRRLEAGEITVYKSPTCVCCGRWIDHMRRAGFRITEESVIDPAAIKRRLDVPEGMYSCHTSVAGGRVIEGHVPADLVHRFLREQSQAIGLAVPGMPAGAPGMEGARKEIFEVLAFTRSGEATTYDVR